MVDNRHQMYTVKSKSYQTVKRLFDIVFSLLSIVLLIPFGLIVALIIKLDSKGSVLYAHERMGKDFVPFKMYKFRTMYSGADQITGVFTKKQLAEWEENYKVVEDPRVTRVGKILRETSIDELPQFWNVLRGDMSLIGPRPIVRQELLKYGDRQAELLSIRPGLTGYWQAYARNSVSYDERIRMEMYYVRNCCWRFDLKILFKTVGAVLSRKGAV